MVNGIGKPKHLEKSVEAGVGTRIKQFVIFFSQHRFNDSFSIYFLVSANFAGSNDPLRKILLYKLTLQRRKKCRANPSSLND